jgi:two-component system, LytTR family, response regulator LytT
VSASTIEAPRLRALVVEDEWPARNYLVELLEGTGAAQVVGAVGHADEARRILSEGRDRLAVDVAFVDIELAEKTARAGLELARELLGTPRAPLFVFATAYEQHALEAFELGAADYLLKPFTDERVSQCTDRLRARFPGRAPMSSTARIVARRGNGLVFLDRDEVWAFEASERLTFVHTPHGTFDLELSLSAIESSFGDVLKRVHRSWLVHTAQVRELVRDGSETRIFVGAGLGGERVGVWVPVARERAAQVRAWLLADTRGLKR